MRVPHYSGHPSIVRVWSLSRPSVVRVLTSPPSECGQTHTNSRHTHLPLPHNSSSIPLQSTRTGETYTMPYAAGELCLQHNHTPVDPHGHQCRGGCGGRLHGNCGEVEGESEIHRICPACVSSKQASTAAAGKRKAQGAGCTPKPIRYPSDVANSAPSCTIEGSENPE